MEKTIYNVYVPMESQEQCDRMKQLCIDNNISYWDSGYSFNYEIGSCFGCDKDKDFFVLVDNNNMGHIEVTEKEFIELLKTTK